MEASVVRSAACNSDNQVNATPHAHVSNQTRTVNPENNFQHYRFSSNLALFICLFGKNICPLNQDLWALSVLLLSSDVHTNLTRETVIRITLPSFCLIDLFLIE